jgi:hypothetical protein
VSDVGTKSAIPRQSEEKQEEKSPQGTFAPTVRQKSRKEALDTKDSFREVAPLSGTGNTTLSASTQLTATSVVQNTLTIGAGATLTISAISGGSTAVTSSLTAVPEPATWTMLMLAAMGLGIYWRRRR